jgi:ethanolamine utilization protein EutA
VGAGSHATQLSGSTVYYRDVPFPLKNLPVLRLTRTEQELPPVQLAQVLREKRNWYADQTGSARLAVGLEGFQSPSYQQVVTLAKGLALGLTEGEGVPVCVLERDMAKVLGQILAQKVKGPLLCLDGVAARQGDYIDVGTPIAGGTVLPVVVKTLAFHQ